MRRAALVPCGVLALFVWGGACGGPEPSAWPEAGELRPPPPIASSVGPRKPAAPTMLAWNSDEAIAGLAESCDWQSACFAEIEASAMKSVEILQGVSPACERFVPLACSQIAFQSCAPDACAHIAERCIPECDQTCGACAQTCTKACDACKASCKDDRCRRDCARSCAGCHEGCVKALDHCTSAECVAEADACFDAQASAWETTDCAKVCPSVTACVEHCERKPDEMEYQFFAGACPESCYRRLGKGCPTSFADVCKGGDSGGFFHSWYDERKKTKK